MKIKSRRISVIICSVMAAVFALYGLSGCKYNDEYGRALLDYMVDDLALALIGDDEVFWNCISVSPEESFGYAASGDPEWYAYSAVSADDLSGNASVLKAYRNELKKIRRSALSDRGAILYDELENILDLYIDYYGSPYASAFVLLGGGYISDDGGYVAEFASSCENYSFRTENDVRNLLDLTESTGVFGTYVDYAEARAMAGYPLFDYTVTAMRDYLSDVLTQGSEYYLYTLLADKVNGAEFLSDIQKSYYSEAFERALTDNFMTGVRELYDGLEDYTGNEIEVEQSYLASYGKMGRAYYEWCFKQKTGIDDPDITGIYNDMVDSYNGYIVKLNAVVNEIKALEFTDKAVYDEFNEYLRGERALLGLTDPLEMLDYLKTAAQSIVPSLSSEPDIGIKYMDETAGEISNAVAYYLLSPIDDLESAEYITLNSCNIDDSFDLLVTMAHEGYPGHLFAHTYTKNMGTSLLSVLARCPAFTEGWAMYVELALLKNIAGETNDRAVKLFCEYSAYDILANYLTMSLYDMEINYFGSNVSDFMKLGVDEDIARNYIQIFMGIPTTYISYGYGMQELVDIHVDAQRALGDRYDEVEFNRVLFSEGAAPTLERARSITSKYIASV